MESAGPWLRPALAKKGVADPALALGVIAQMMDLFNDMLASLATQHPLFHYIDLRDDIQDSDWVNELHLSNDAYRRVAGKFDAVIRNL